MDCGIFAWIAASLAQCWFLASVPFAAGAGTKALNSGELSGKGRAVRGPGRGRGGTSLYCMRSPLTVEKTPIGGLLLLTPRRFGDDRGWFSESWNRRTLEQEGVKLPEFVQDNHSLSRQSGTIRGLHYQSPPHAQGKLVRCGRGRLFDVAVDARRGSPTFGQWFGAELTHENGVQLWIPAGFLHGFLTLTDDTEIIYKCTDHYAPESDGAVRWNSCGIDWPLAGDITPRLSQKDDAAPAFAEFTSPFEYGRP